VGNFVSPCYFDLRPTLLQLACWCVRADREEHVQAGAGNVSVDDAAFGSTHWNIHPSTHPSMRNPTSPSKSVAINKRDIKNLYEGGGQSWCV